MKVAVVIPAHNEEKTLARNVGVLLDFLSCSAGPHEFATIIAENGSTDGTFAVGSGLAASRPGVSCMRLPSAGRGAALKTAWAAADGADVVGYMDADLATELEALPRAIAALEAGAAIVSGSRLHGASVIRRSLRREVLSRGYNLLMHGLLGVDISDAQCGFKFLWRKHALAIVPAIENDNWFFDTELLVRGAWAGLRVAEIPVTWSEKRERKSTVRIIPTMFEEFGGLLRLRASRRAQ